MISGVEEAQDLGERKLGHFRPVLRAPLGHDVRPDVRVARAVRGWSVQYHANILTAIAPAFSASSFQLGTHSFGSTSSQYSSNPSVCTYKMGAVGLSEYDVPLVANLSNGGNDFSLRQMEIRYSLFTWQCFISMKL